MKKILIFVGIVSLLVWWSRSPPGDLDIASATETVWEVGSSMLDAVAGFLREIF